MNILILSPKPPWPPFDGGALAISGCINGLAAAGIPISLLTMRTEKHKGKETAYDTDIPVLRYYETVEVDTRIKPLKILSNFLFSEDPYDLTRFRSSDYTRALDKILSTEKFDIIQCEGPIFSYYIDTIRSHTGSPIVMRAHNLEHRIRKMMAKSETNIFKKFYLKNLARRIKRFEISAVSRFDAVVPVSEPDYKWFMTVAPAKAILLCEPGINEHKTDLYANEACLNAGFIGALNWQPNIDGLQWFLEKVWPAVTAVMPDAIFHIAGRGVSDSLRRTLKGKNIVFDGEVNDSGTFTSSMAVMIAPLFAGSGIRMKILEAMSYGRTVIATSVAAAGLPVEDGRNIFICNDARRFSETLITLLGNSELRKRTGNAAREMVTAHFDNRKQTALLLDFYSKLCDGC